ncbi:hypothetical protein RhiXN_03525 [Rhizoctonia solani]|uniref:Uncharacterized protein n=1 Tax=Rhizoctonia solani TaxID=456999 RepID=A0A8H8SS21_9AGAM|nr:uncharacterized protein RhiXN_03525 [Rhizoctonia solani]QRW15524.1 hypothetical protein RhiXN_03525 [Rhizoctonia solani]
MSFSQDYYCYPIFTSYRNDVPLTPELGIIEASHVRDLYYVYANRHNDHYSPYSENHPDPLERRIHAMPDIEVFLMDEDHPPQWFLGVDLTTRCTGLTPMLFVSLAKLYNPLDGIVANPGPITTTQLNLSRSVFPYIPRPICFREDVYHFPADSFHELQQQVHHNNFYAICLNALSIIITATKQMEYSNIAHVGYIRVEHSEDDLSDAGFPVNGYDGNDKALGPITPPPENVPPPHLVDFAEVPFDYAAWGLPPREPSEQPETTHLGYQNGDSFTAPEYAPLHAANKAGEFPAPEYAHSHELDIAALTQQLSLVAVAHSVESVSPGFGNDFVESVWEWPGEPNPVVDLGPPEWPTVPQQHTPPFSWEDHWHEVHARDLKLGDNKDVNIGGGLEIALNTSFAPFPSSLTELTICLACIYYIPTFPASQFLYSATTNTLLANLILLTRLNNRR